MLPPSQFVGFASWGLARSAAMRALLLAVWIVVSPTAVLAQAAIAGVVLLLFAVVLVVRYCSADEEVRYQPLPEA